MNYKILGRSKIKVSEIGIGGEGFENKSFEECEEIVDFAMESKINFFDLYNSNPKVRSNIGKALKKYPRESFVIEGHLCTTWENKQYKRTRNIDEIKSSFSDLLKRLDMDYIDIGMIHYIDEEKDFDNIFNGEIIEFVKDLKLKGVIKSIGISTHNVDIGFKAVESRLVDVILFSINPAYDMLPLKEDAVEVLFETNPFEDGLYKGIDPKREKFYKTCENENIALTVMKGYGAGILLSDEQSPFKKAMTPVNCIHYCLTRPAVSSVMIGVSNIEEIKDALKYYSSSEKEKDFTYILSNRLNLPFEGHCMYCGHCSPCTKKIDIASVNKYLDLALIQDEISQTLIDHYELLKHHGGECIKCGICMKNCPFKVDIISKMEKAVDVFGK